MSYQFRELMIEVGGDPQCTAHTKRAHPAGQEKCAASSRQLDELKASLRQAVGEV